MANEPKSSTDSLSCVRCGEALLGREPLCPHCQTRVRESLDIAGHPGRGEQRLVAFARVALTFSIVGALGFLAAAGGMRLLWGSWIVPLPALGALAASTTFILLVGPLSIIESVRRAVSPNLRKLEAKIGPAVGNHAFIVEAPEGSLGVLVVGDATYALYRVKSHHADLRELSSLNAVEGSWLSATTLLVGADSTGAFGLTFFLRSRRPGSARRALVRALMSPARLAQKQARRDEVSSPRPAVVAPASKAPAPRASPPGGESSSTTTTKPGP